MNREQLIDQLVAALRGSPKPYRVWLKERDEAIAAAEAWKREQAGFVVGQMYDVADLPVGAVYEAHQGPLETFVVGAQKERRGIVRKLVSLPDVIADGAPKVDTCPDCGVAWSCVCPASDERADKAGEP